MSPECSDEQESIKPQSWKRKKKRLRKEKLKTKDKELINIDLDMIVAYCLECVTWEEAKPVVNMIEKMFGMNAPPKVKDAIRRIKRHFDRKIHSRIVKAKKVVMEKAHIKGAINSIRNNKMVNLGE